MSSGGLGLTGKHTWPALFRSEPTAADVELAALLTELTDAEQPPAGGACAEPGVDPELFWPISDTVQVRQVTQAKAICAGCPVLADCRTFGMTQAEGIWGGMTATERRELRAQEERHRAELERLADVEQAAVIVAEVA